MVLSKETIDSVPPRTDITMLCDELATLPESSAAMLLISYARLAHILVLCDHADLEGLQGVGDASDVSHLDSELDQWLLRTQIAAIDSALLSSLAFYVRMKIHSLPGASGLSRRALTAAMQATHLLDQVCKITMPAHLPFIFIHVSGRFQKGSTQLKLMLL